MSRMERRRSEARSHAASEHVRTGSKGTERKAKKKNLAGWLSDLATWKKVTLLVALVAVLALLIAGIMLKDFAKQQHEEIYVETPEDYDLSLTAVDGYINILLLGVDSRDMENIKGTRSDAIMVVSINEETNDVKIISTYRDTYLRMGDTPTYDKITHACAYGGPEMTMKSLNQVMDLNIENYVVVNFKAVADLVDAVGGITVNVEEYEIAQLNKYTKQTAKNIGRKDYQLVEAAGNQTLDGCQAVSYARIRKGVGDDFKRTERMRTVLTKVFAKMKYMSFSEVKALIPLMTSQVQTNLDMENILGLAAKLPSFNIMGSTGWPYNVTAGYIGQLSYILPVNIVNDTVRLHQEMFGQADYVPSDSVRNISATIAAKIQEARDNAEIEGEEEVIIEENDPTQIGDDMDPAINPETGLPWDPADPDYPDDLLNPDYDLTEPDGEEGDYAEDSDMPGTEGNQPADPAAPGNTGDNTGTGDGTASGEIQDDPDEEIVYDDPDEQVVSPQGT